MDNFARAIRDSIPLFKDDKQALIYLTLIREGSLGAEKLSQKTGLHREIVQRNLKKMSNMGLVKLIKAGRNKKAQAVSVSTLQETIEKNRDNFDLILKPLLEAEGNKKSPKIEIYTNNHNFGLLQLKLIKLQPAQHDIQVISTQPKQWVASMVESKKLDRFESIRLSKEIPFLLSCFSELRGQVEHNNREYFAGQPAKLKRQYRYVETEASSPLQVQIWFNHVVISIFEATPSLHIVIEDSRVVKAMRAYFAILWGIGTK
jgi:sugar-specific transcriptional regulator TrmB